MSNWFKTTSIYWLKKPTAISTPTNKKKKKSPRKRTRFLWQNAIPKGLALNFSFICLMSKGSVYFFSYYGFTPMMLGEDF